MAVSEIEKERITRKCTNMKNNNRLNSITKIFLLIGVLVALSLAGGCRSNTGNVGNKATEDYKKSAIEADSIKADIKPVEVAEVQKIAEPIDSVAAPKSYVEGISPVPLVKRTTFCFENSGREDIYFGKIDSDAYSYSEKSLKLPPFKSLVHKTAHAYCLKDTCYHNYAVLALRCPPNRVLLNWLTKNIRSWVSFCLGNFGQEEEEVGKAPIGKFNSAKEICQYYMKWLDKKMKAKKCMAPEDKWYCFQEGYILADCWNRGNLYTFYEVMWHNYNGMSDELYLTIDAVTGKELTLTDIVDSTKFDQLSKLMLERLVDVNGVYYISEPSMHEIPPEELIYRSDGCALIEEGLYLYFNQYSIGSGAQGRFVSIIPYKELTGLLNKRISKVIKQKG